MLGKLIQPELEELVRAGQLGELRELLIEMAIPDVAELIDDLPPQDMALCFRLLPRQLAADVYEYLPFESQEAVLRSLGQEDVANILNEMNPDDRTALLEELPGEVTRELLRLLSPQELNIAKRLLGYPEESIGRIMTPDYLVVRKHWTIAEVFDYVRKHGHDSETINILYAIDERGHLLDDIRLREVILSPPEKLVEDLMDHQFVSLVATDDQETAVAAFRKYDRVALPVTDSGGILVGIVTIDDVLDVAEEEATEDIQKLGGMEALDLPYLSTRLPEMIRKRAPWLMVLFLGEMLTTWAMAVYGTQIEKVVVLAFFVPLIISSGGNSGSQAASLIIRALALGEVHLIDWWRVMRRELLTGVTLGLILAVMGFFSVLAGHLYHNVNGNQSETSLVYVNHWLPLSLTLGCTLVGVVMWGTLMGSLLPLLMKRLKFDPATSSTPFVATLVDVTGLLIYFSVASVLLKGTLL